MTFKSIELGDKAAIKPMLQNNCYHTGEYSFGNMIIWSELYRPEFAIEDDIFFVRGKIENKTFYQLPVCKDLKKGIDRLMELLERGESSPAIYGIPLAQMEQIERLYPGVFEFRYRRDRSDYVYNKSDLADYPGRKYHAKRNYVNRFLKTFGEINSEPVSPENIDEIRDFQSRWLARTLENHDQSVLEENTAVLRCLDNFSELDMFGVLVRARGRVVAYGIGEMLCEKIAIQHIEKADYEIAGAYPVVTSEFAKSLPARVTYINREEDLGIEGLRKAKESLFPCRLEDKFTAKLR